MTKTVAARNAGPNSPSNANSTLNRPMASQGGTRYEDRSGQGVTPDSRVAAPSLNIHPVSFLYILSSVILHECKAYTVCMSSILPMCILH